MLQRWVIRFVRLIDKRVRQKKKPGGKSWRMDETYVKLNEKWVYLYRALGKEGNIVDCLLRARRNKDAAKAFFRKAFKKNGSSEEEKIEVWQIKYLNNMIEQDHRFIKKRTRLALGFKDFHAAEATLSGIENIRMIQKWQIVGQTVCQFSFKNFAALMA